MHILALPTKIGNSITSKRIDEPVRQSLKIIFYDVIYGEKSI